MRLRKLYQDILVLISVMLNLRRCARKHGSKTINFQEFRDQRNENYLICIESHLDCIFLKMCPVRFTEKRIFDNNFSDFVAGFFLCSSGVTHSFSNKLSAIVSVYCSVTHCYYLLIVPDAISAKDLQVLLDLRTKKWLPNQIKPYVFLERAHDKFPIKL